MAIGGPESVQLPQAGRGKELSEDDALTEQVGLDQENCDDTEEEDGIDGDEELDRREFGIYQCLPYEPGEPDWESGEPKTVEEYLRRVRYEAQQLPDVVSSSPPPQQHAADAPHKQREHYSSPYLAADPGVTPCDDRLKPSSAWIRDFLQQFAQLRLRLQREHVLSSGQAPVSPCGGGGLRLSPHLANSSGDASAVAQHELAALSLQPSPSAAMPELQQLQGQDQLQVRRQLHGAMRQVVQEESMSSGVAALLYALSARIEKPLHAGTCALYRQLLRLCAAQRAALPGGSTDPLLPHLNLLICIAGAYFGQDEELAAMWDDEE